MRYRELSVENAIYPCPRHKLCKGAQKPQKAAAAAMFRLAPPQKDIPFL
jgi:hypothetical protein